MSNRVDFTTIEVPVVLRDRLLRLRVHHRQGMHEVVEAALDFWEDARP
jgi:hypothetical protein